MTPEEEKKYKEWLLKSAQQEPQKLTINITHRGPCLITASDWPVIAHGAYDNAWMQVRQHKDGRIIVYGDYNGVPGENGPAGKGELIPSRDGVVDAIFNVSERLSATIPSGQWRPVRDNCIWRLPVEELI